MDFADLFIVTLLPVILLCVLIILNDGLFLARNPWGIGLKISEEFEERERKVGKFFAPKLLWVSCALLFLLFIFKDDHFLITLIGWLGAIATFIIPIVVKLKKLLTDLVKSIFVSLSFYTKLDFFNLKINLNWYIIL